MPLKPNIEGLDLTLRAQGMGIPPSLISEAPSDTIPIIQTLMSAPIMIDQILQSRAAVKELEAQGISKLFIIAEKNRQLKKLGYLGLMLLSIPVITKLMINYRQAKPGVEASVTIPVTTPTIKNINRPGGGYRFK